MSVARFMATGIGRALRIILGVVLIAVGLLAVGGTAGWIIALVGLIPIAAGAFNFCIIAPLIGAPLRGDDVGRPAA